MKKSVKISLISLTVFFAVIAVTVGVFFLLISPNVNILGAPELNAARLTSYSRTITISDAYGDPIDSALYDKNKIYVMFDDLDRHTVDAFVAIEDKRFFEHKGVDYRRFASALLANIKAGKFREGASTITQQLIKNTHLSGEKTIKRKLSEMRLARKLETVYGKEQILESYFNILYFGSGIHGLGTAAKIMFGKPASELSIAESAALAAIINNPSKYSPYNNIENLVKRKNLVLKEMLGQKKISADEYNEAFAEKLDFKSFRQTQFVSGVIKDACKRLNCSEKQLFSLNCELKTSYEPSIADGARKILNSKLDSSYAARILVLKNDTGAIVCDETNRSSYINNKRSPASTIKPFVSYAPALENGYNPLSQINDELTVFGDYAPHNYKDIYRGYQSLKDCLIYSSNVAAVSLLDAVGIERGKAVAGACGLSFAENDDTLALALGGMTDGVTLTELANAYRTLANCGVRSDTHYLSSASYDTGGEVGRAFGTEICAMNDDSAYLITDMLMDCAKRGTAKKLKNLGSIAAKTGTNGDKNGNRDCYCIAYTPIYTIAVWYGAEDTLIPNNVTGATCSADIVRLAEYCDLGLNKEFYMPNTVAYYEIDDLELRNSHTVYLADPLLPQRYRRRALLSKRHLPIRKNIDIIDYFDRELWDGKFDLDFGFDLLR